MTAVMKAKKSEYQWVVYLVDCWVAMKGRMKAVTTVEKKGEKLDLQTVERKVDSKEYY